MKKNQNISPKREKFNEQHDGLSDSEMLREHLYAQQLIYDKLEKIRKNTSNLVFNYSSYCIFDDTCHSANIFA